MAKPRATSNTNRDNNNKNIRDNFNNKSYRISLQDTSIVAGEDVVVKNAPFLIVVSSNPGDESSISATQDTQDITVDLVEADNVDQAIVCRTTSSFDHNVYLKEGSITVEARIHVLSSKQEGISFRMTIKFGSQSVVSPPIKCVSKLDPKKKRNISDLQQQQSQQIIIEDEQQQQEITNNNNNNNNNKNKRKQLEPITPTTLISTPSNINSINNNTTLSNTLAAMTNDTRVLKKVKRQQKKDRELISLLYKQNVMLVNQINVLTSGLNKLISVHNDTLLSVPASPPCLPPAYSPVSPPCSSQQTAPQLQLCFQPQSQQMSSLPSSPEVVPSSMDTSSSLSFPMINTDMLENLGLAMHGSSDQHTANPANGQQMQFDGNCSFGSFLVKCNGDAGFSNFKTTNTAAAATKQEDNQQQVIRMSDYIEMSNYQQPLSSACCTNNSSHDNTYSHSLLDLNHLDFNNVEYSSSPLPSPNFNDNVPSESDMIIIQPIYQIKSQIRDDITPGILAVVVINTLSIVI
ncbi:hypothetical protein DFA_05218 [Cavenderia fasciculata]|uniref:Uncharacterized protein n=1 Tax=Cavenderia fasciculata TaxID=261658 RepID=F4PNN5_CACFS|nr:uncharacterized protein DFA_05218 [Cavenderia fasciculata]EGG23088.1 hypothetical protein DFA_05218 [Cavenderia fasciculata]|eukprot:XP_004360939.1 hypothetical protein DFA_05218 [Cavenderia fasciculata]